MSDQPTTTQDPIRAVPAPAPPEVEPELDLHDPALYDNRELSWVEFNGACSSSPSSPTCRCSSA